MFVILRLSLLGMECAFKSVLVQGSGVVVTKGLVKVMNKKAASVSRDFHEVDAALPMVLMVPY